MEQKPLTNQVFKKGFGFLWLAYLGFLLLDPLLEPHRHIWLPTLAVIAVFLAVFYIHQRASNPTVHRWMIFAIFLLALITMPWNSGAITFFVYAAALLPFSLESTPLILACFSVEVFAAVAETYWLHINWFTACLASFLLLVIGGGNIFFAEQKRTNCKLRLKQEEVEAMAAVAERERIARDLHDVLGHTLSVIVLKAELASRLIQRSEASDQQRAATEIADVERIARTALSEVREAIGGYRTRGLAAEIDAARLTLDAAGVTLILDSEAASAAHLSAEEETALALALREAVTNIVRHARASTCRLRFITENHRRRLIVEDNGEHAITREGNGLRGMRERIEALGGHLSLERDHGTRLLIELPPRSAPVSFRVGTAVL